MVFLHDYTLDMVIWSLVEYYKYVIYIAFLIEILLVILMICYYYTELFFLILEKRNVDLEIVIDWIYQILKFLVFILQYMGYFIIFLFSLRIRMTEILTDIHEFWLLNAMNFSTVSIVLIGLLLFLLLCSLTIVSKVYHVFSKETHYRLLAYRRLLFILNIVSLISIVVYCLSNCILYWNVVKMFIKVSLVLSITNVYYFISMILLINLSFYYIVYLYNKYILQIVTVMDIVDQMYNKQPIVIRVTMWLYYIGLVLYCVIIYLLCIYTNDYLNNTTIPLVFYLFERKALNFVFFINIMLLLLILFTIFVAVLVKSLTNVAHRLSLGKNTLLILTNIRRFSLLLNMLYFISFAILNFAIIILVLFYRATIFYSGWILLILIVVCIIIYIILEEGNNTSKNELVFIIKNRFFEVLFICYYSNKWFYCYITNSFFEVCILHTKKVLILTIKNRFHKLPLFEVSITKKVLTIKNRFHKLPRFSTSIFRDKYVLIKIILQFLLACNVFILIKSIFVYGYIWYVFSYRMLRIFYISVILLLLDVLQIKKGYLKNINYKSKKKFEFRWWMRYIKRILFFVIALVFVSFIFL